MSGRLGRAVGFVALLAIALLAGVAVTFASAFLGHEVLVLLYGESLAPIDDTLPMIAAVWGSYLAGIVSGLVVLVAGLRLRRPGHH